MAIAVPTTASDYSTASSGSANTLAVAKPVNIANNDLLVAHVYFRNAAGTLTADAGWSLISPTDSNETAGTWVKGITNAAGEAANYNFGITGVGSSRCGVIVFRITGADIVTPLDVAGSISGTTGTASITIPGLTTGTNNAELLSLGNCSTSGTTASTFTAPGGTTTLTQLGFNNGTSSSSIWVGFEAVATAGTATGTRTPTLSPSASNSTGWLLSIRPAGAAIVKTDSARPGMAGMFLDWRAAAPAFLGDTRVPVTRALAETGHATDALTVTASVPLRETATATDMLLSIPPSGIAHTVEIEFTAGVWTDVTSYVDSGWTINRSRSSQFSPVATATLSGLALDNRDGRFTPRRQVLVDGTAHPYYPNVEPRKRIRVSYVAGGTRWVRFIGRIKAWPPSIEAGAYNTVTIEATDEMDRLSRVKMANPYTTAVLASNPAHYWPLDEPAGSTSFVSLVSRRPLTTQRLGTGYGSIVGMDNGPGADNGNGWAGTMTTPANGPYLYSRLTAQTGTTVMIECWMKGAPTYVAFGGAFDWTGGAGEISGSGTANTDADVKLGAALDTSTLVHAGPGSARVGSDDWVHLVGTFTDGLAALYANGEIVVAASGTSLGRQITVSKVTLWRSCITGLVSSGDIAHVSVYIGSPSLSDILSHYDAGIGLIGETTGARVKRYLGYAGITDPTLLNLETGVATCGPYGQKGIDVVQASQDACATEGAGSVFYIAPDGRARFTSRTFRARNTTPAMTLDAVNDLINSPWRPTYDESLLANSVTAERATYAGTQTSRVVTDATSITDYGLSADSVTSYALGDDDVLYNAQERLGQRRRAAFRLPQAAVELQSATTNLYIPLGQLEIGSRIRITNVPAGALPGTQIDGYIEGWTETCGVGGTTYTATFDLSPAGRGVTGAVGESAMANTARAQCDGQTLANSISNSATTVVIQSPFTGPTFTTNAAQYPVTIQINEEQITLPAAPPSSDFPQTFTGCTRGANGTPAAPQTVGATVRLAPVHTAAL